MSDRLRMAIVIPVVTWAMLLASAAYAGIATQGSDESYGINSGTKVEVCDRESDGRGVHADAYNQANQYFRVDDMDGSSGDCYPTSYMGSIDEHRTVEEINNWPDAKGDWSDHFGPCTHC